MTISVADKLRALHADMGAGLVSIPGEIERLAEYLKDPGASRETAFRSSAAQADHRMLTAAYPRLHAAHAALSEVLS